MSTITLDIGVAVLLSAVVLVLLPTSPFTSLINETSQISEVINMGYVNWFIPFKQIVAIGEAWLAAVVVYYMYEYILRFIKLVG